MNKNAEKLIMAMFEQKFPTFNLHKKDDGITYENLNTEAMYTAFKFGYIVGRQK